MFDSQDRTPPLTGLRAVEAGGFTAAPFAIVQLVDLAADVIKVESPRCDLVRDIGGRVEGRSAPLVRVNQGKRSVALDVRAADDGNR
jgi:crotonobetainyl-CoA:carnitine CoA-transferase CaiB-like acyl-CoA transferase